MTLPEGFQITYWSDGERFPGIPLAPDRYQRGSVSWGKDPKRGRAIINARSRKKRATNEAFFMAEIYPHLRGNLSPEQSKSLAQSMPPEIGAGIYREGGWVRYAMGERASWIHPETEPDKVRQALELGAKPVDTVPGV